MRVLIGIAAIALLVPMTSPARAQDDPRLWRAYHHAIKDAMQPERNEVVRTLVPLNRRDRRVQWRTIDGRRYVLVTTLRRNALTDVRPGEAFQVSGDKWVVLPRQLRARCARLRCAGMRRARLDLTLKQLIGVPPDADYHVVNSFWARPRDMFRPCRTPDVRATSCRRRARAPLPVVRGVSVRTFLRDQAAYAWRVPKPWNPPAAVSCASVWPEPANCLGFPWTRLGYAYDWAPGRDEVGLTEFVVADGATVYLHRVEGQRELIGN